MAAIAVPATPMPIASTPTERPPGASRLHFDHGYPASVKRDDIQRLLQGMVTAAHGTGFLHLGDDADFSHGHIIFGPKPWQGEQPARSAAMAASGPERFNWEPIAVLYHTQEAAFDAERVAAPNHRYVDRMRRNWLQLWDGRLVDIANYLRPNEKMNDHFTLFEFQLDGARLGARTVSFNSGSLEQVWGSFQFQFRRVDAGAFDAARDDMVTVSLPTGEPVYLQLSSNLSVRELQNPYRHLPAGYFAARPETDRMVERNPLASWVTSPALTRRQPEPANATGAPTIAD